MGGDSEAEGLSVLVSLLPLVLLDRHSAEGPFAFVIERCPACRDDEMRRLHPFSFRLLAVSL